MFISPSDLGNAMYGYQIEQITEGDDAIVLQAIAAAEQEVRAYLDGATRYDVDAIFSATGAARNALLVTHTATVAKWHIVELCNADIIYEQAKDRYDRAIAWLRDLAKGVVSLGTLPTIPIGETEGDEDTFGFGSRVKFNHDI